MEEDDEEGQNTEDTSIDPAAYLPIIFPWLTEHGMCIMPMPRRQKTSQSTKQKAKWVNELQNLHSTVNYDKAPKGRLMERSTAAL